MGFVVSVFLVSGGQRGGGRGGAVGGEAGIGDVFF